MEVQVSCAACDETLKITEEWTEKGKLQLKVGPCKNCSLSVQSSDDEIEWLKREPLEIYSRHPEVTVKMK